MAEFRQLIITNKGQALMAKMIAGSGNVQFTKIATSSNVYSDAQILALTSLANVKQTTLISKVIRTNNVAVQVEGAITNAQLSTGYTMNTIALYALDPDDGEIIYAACGASSPGYMPPYNGITTSGAFFKLVTTVGNAENVTLNVDPAAVATIGDIQDLQKQISDLQSYVGYTETDIVGVEVDFKNNKFTRLAGAINRTPGAAFDNIKAFGGRKRCIVADDGSVLAYYGEAAYTEKGSLLQTVIKGGKTYEIGSNVQVMVEQPKFYYKVVPLQLDRVEFKEINTIAITAGASANGNVIINLDGKDFTVAVAANDDATAVASRIRNATYAGWTTGGSGTSVSFTSSEVGVRTTATFNAASTGVTATVTKTQPGYIGKGFHMRKVRYYVADTKKNGFKLHPAFKRNGVEKNFIYLSAYEGCTWNPTSKLYDINDSQTVDFTNHMLSSIAGAKPTSGAGNQSGATRAGFRAIAAKRGSGNGWTQQTVQAATATEMLFLVEYASFDMQSKIGIGVTNKPWFEDAINYSEVTGATTNLGNATGAVTNTNGFNVISYRGEENFFGNIWKWVDGININAKGIHEAYIADNAFADDKIDGNYTNAGITLSKTNGYVSAFGYNEDYDWLFLASETVGNSSLPVGDYFYQNNAYNSGSGIMVAILGGFWTDGANAGGFYWYVNDVSSYRARTIGGRLLYVPQ